MIKMNLTLPAEAEEVFDGLTDDEMNDILLEAAEGFCGPGGVLEKHFEAGQTAWANADDDYLVRKARDHGSTEKFVKTGAAKAALTGPSPYRVIKVHKRGGHHTVEVGLVRIEGGRNVYSIAQAGGRNLGGPSMRITDELPGDEEIVGPHVEAAIERMLKRKGVL